MLAILSYLAVIIGVPLVLIQMRQNNRIREGEVVNNIMRELMELQIIKNWATIQNSPYRTYSDVLKEPDPDKRNEFMVVIENAIGTFEGCGVLVARGIVSLDVVDYYAHGIIRELWLRVGPIIEGYREETKHYEYAEWVEFLYQRIYGGMSNMQALAEVKAKRNLRASMSAQNAQTK